MLANHRKSIYEKEQGLHIRYYGKKIYLCLSDVKTGPKVTGARKLEMGFF